MRIDDLNRTPLTQAPEKTDPAAAKPGSEKTNLAEGSDQAEVSALARALSAGDPARVEQLRMEVQSGKYQVSAAELANSIINAHSKE